MRGRSRIDVPDAEVVLLDGGHFLLQTAVRELGQLMLEFLGRKGLSGAIVPFEVLTRACRFFNASVFFARCCRPSLSSVVSMRNYCPVSHFWLFALLRVATFKPLDDHHHTRVL